MDSGRERALRWRPIETLPGGDVDTIEAALGWRPTRLRPSSSDRGESPTAARWIVEDGRGRTAFVKVGATQITAEWNRTEHRHYQAIHGWYMPRLLGFADGERPVLAIEDLSDALWPPPWNDARVAAVLETVAAVGATPPPPELHALRHDAGSDWRQVAEDPEPLLALGLCTPTWLTKALPALEEAASGAALFGTTLGHLDLRSDNICLRDGRALLIDWNHAALAGPQLDLAAWLPSLHAEGGPPPESILPDAPGLAAWAAGFFCARAGLAPVPDAPHVRPLQLRQAVTALPWAARALGLPTPTAD